MDKIITIDNKQNDLNIDNVVNNMELLVDDYINDHTDIFFKDDHISIELVNKYFNSILMYLREYYKGIIDNNNIYQLDTVFNNYMIICNKFDIIPTIQAFTILVNLYDSKYYRRLDLQNERGDAVRVTPEERRILKKWHDTCKDFLVDKLTNTRGGDVNRIFVAKAVYGLAETVAVSREEITRSLPASELPDLSDDSGSNN